MQTDLAGQRREMSCTVSNVAAKKATQLLVDPHTLLQAMVRFSRIKCLWVKS